MALSGYSTPTWRTTTPQPGIDYTSTSPQPLNLTVSGLLYDMDGTLIDSTSAIVKHWTQIASVLGITPESILATSHGRRSIDVLEVIQPDKANWEYVRAIEGQIPLKYGDDAVEIPGARGLLDRMEVLKVPWAIVTSGTRPLVEGWLDRLKLAKPENLVTAEDVPRGKPDPACYLLGRKRLGLMGDRISSNMMPVEKKDEDVSTAAGDVPSTNGVQAVTDPKVQIQINGLPSSTSTNDLTHLPVLVFEDAPAGIKAGKAAGCLVLGLATTHEVSQIRDAGADWIVRDLRSVGITSYDSKTGRIGVEIKDIFR